ncbi:MAG: UDP-N-acetylglucosamine--N-acetylmuramyl-(pentapeptide) pyrophosphoryl-undecaprenol N-acetylglucosamine transferase [Candidatus Nomurabacteria bacterium]|nr:UDP-N-acetylglucosamine--N-acetylmuramyl-(pentapeptide) pyrophosphoryl-undecaprenol N-acetylglucosamine transferase [Candidatus Nomurabacteria bacterium]
MKIVFTGGGTGGHFYPIIAVAQNVNKIIDKEKILNAKLYYISDSPYDKEALFENGLIYEEIKTGKMRTYFSMKNFSDMIKTFLAIFSATYKIYSIYPDVIFGKGGYASFPTLVAARILNIPVVIHESDSAPGRVNLWAGRFAKKIAISFEEAGLYFPKDKTAWTGQPIRSEITQKTSRAEALQYWKLESNIPVVVILGGSQGAELINNVILDALPRLVENFQVIHQTGVRNFKMVDERSEVVLANNVNKSRYQKKAFLNNLELKMSAGVASIIVSRAGSGLFEISTWGIPSILIPITKTNMDHQKKNAFNYARAGACSVIEEMNMTANILVAEIERILGDKITYERMAESAKNFNKIDAGEKIAKAIVDIALKHEK